MTSFFLYWIYSLRNSNCNSQNFTLSSKIPIGSQYMTGFGKTTNFIYLYQIYSYEKTNVIIYVVVVFRLPKEFFSTGAPFPYACRRRWLLLPKKRLHQRMEHLERAQVTRRFPPPLLFVPVASAVQLLFEIFSLRPASTNWTPSQLMLEESPGF